MISAEGVGKAYEDGLVQALVRVDFRVEAGEILSLMGPSGSGKSTLLHLLGTLDTPSAGRITWQGRSLRELGPLPAWRARNVGFIFQFHHLLPTMTLLENVEAALLPLGMPRAERRARAEEELSLLGLSARLHFFPARVSGGERQRAAIARALVGPARVVLADEPTGQLDEATGRQAAEHLVRRCSERGTALILVTHNPAVAGMAPRRLSIRDGAIVGDETSRPPLSRSGEGPP